MVRWLRVLVSLMLALGAAGGARAAATCPPPLPAQAATAPQADRGLLWRVSRDGRTGWLYGTLHVGKPGWQRLGPRVAWALRNSDVLALEIDPNDPALMAALAELRATALPEPLQARLTQAYERACVAPESLASLHPVLQATTLTVLEARWLGMDPAYAMEQVLAAQARGQGRRVVSLETAAQQKAALVPDDPAEALSSLDQSLAQLEDGSGRRVLQHMAQAWEGGDLAALEDFDRWCECVATEADRAFMRKLNDERNGPLAARIEAQHRKGLRVFAAVGALHMTGPQSLPKLLTQRGFKVERVSFGAP
jgi:uncharacterized protein YbaP (TraB family)